MVNGVRHLLDDAGITDRTAQLHNHIYNVEQFLLRVVVRCGRSLQLFEQLLPQLVVFLLLQTVLHHGPSKIALDEAQAVLMGRKIGDDIIHKDNDIFGKVLRPMLLRVFVCKRHNISADLQNQMFQKLVLILKIKIECALCDLGRLCNLADAGL